jgi:hypothetical protein
MKALIEAIQAAAANLEKSRAAHESSVSALGTVRGLGGQGGYAVTVNGIRIDVAVHGGREAGYNAKMIRGREMIHLGALKALQSIIDQHAADVKVNEARVKALAERLSHANP